MCSRVSTSNCGDDMEEEKVLQSTDFALRPTKERRGELMPNALATNNLTNASGSIDLALFKSRLQEQEQKLEQQNKQIKQRLLVYDHKLKLKQNLKKKIKPFIKDASVVPMNIFFTLVVFDGGLLKPFTMLCKGFRKHILFEFKNQFAPAVEKFKEAYKDYFEFDSMHLWRSSIAYGSQQGTRIDQVLKLRVKSICK